MKYGNVFSFFLKTFKNLWGPAHDKGLIFFLEPCLFTWCVCARDVSDQKGMCVFMVSTLTKCQVSMVQYADSYASNLRHMRTI